MRYTTLKSLPYTSSTVENMKMNEQAALRLFLFFQMRMSLPALCIRKQNKQCIDCLKKMLSLVLFLQWTLLNSNLHKISQNRPTQPSLSFRFPFPFQLAVSKERLIYLFFYKGILKKHPVWGENQWTAGRYKWLNSHYINNKADKR